MNLKKNYTTADFKISEEVNIADAELGRRIYHVRAGCVDCHGEDLAGIKIMDNPAMGTIYGANITPYNMLEWTDEEIARAIRYGVHKSGRSLRFMPSFDYEGYSKEDIAALVKYIRSSQTVARPNKENSFGPIARVMTLLNKMPVMFPAAQMDLTKGFSEKPLEEESVQFGKYLAQSCIGCHGADLKGGPIPGGDPSWPEATNIRLGSIEQYNKETFINMMKTGVSPVTNEKIRPPMPTWLLSKYDETETNALWLYLSSLK